MRTSEETNRRGGETPNPRSDISTPTRTPCRHQRERAKISNSAAPFLKPTRAVAPSGNPGHQITVVVTAATEQPGPAIAVATPPPPYWPPRTLRGGFPQPTPHRVAAWSIAGPARRAMRKQRSVPLAGNAKAGERVIRPSETLAADETLIALGQIPMPEVYLRTGAGDGANVSGERRWRMPAPAGFASRPTARSLVLHVGLWPRSLGNARRAGVRADATVNG
jgi:hypothetical protein